MLSKIRSLQPVTENLHFGVNSPFFIKTLEIVDYLRFLLCKTNNEVCIRIRALARESVLLQVWQLCDVIFIPCYKFALPNLSPPECLTFGCALFLFSFRLYHIQPLSYIQGSNTQRNKDLYAFIAFMFLCVLFRSFFTLMYVHPLRVYTLQIKRVSWIISKYRAFFAFLYIFCFTISKKRAENLLFGVILISQMGSFWYVC